MKTARDTHYRGPAEACRDEDKKPPRSQHSHIVDSLNRVPAVGGHFANLLDLFLISCP